MSVEIKICGITRREDVELAAALGADYIGFVLYPGSRRFVPPERLPELGRGLPPHVGKVGVFVDATRDEILRAAELGGLDVVQLHGHESAEFAQSLGFPRIWKAGYDRDFPAERLVCDAPAGGSGNFGDHEKAAELAKVRCVMLAGGITPDNAGSLISRVKPAGIDLAGGVESAPGVKDENKLRQLFQNVKGNTL